MSPGEGSFIKNKYPRHPGASLDEGRERPSRAFYQRGEELHDKSATEQLRAPHELLLGSNDGEQRRITKERGNQIYHSSAVQLDTQQLKRVRKELQSAIRNQSDDSIQIMSQVQ